MNIRLARLGQTNFSENLSYINIQGVTEIPDQ